MRVCVYFRVTVYVARKRYKSIFNIRLSNAIKLVTAAAASAASDVFFFSSSFFVWSIFRIFPFAHFIFGIHPRAHIHTHTRTHSWTNTIAHMISFRNPYFHRKYFLLYCRTDQCSANILRFIPWIDYASHTTFISFIHIFFLLISHSFLHWAHCVGQLRFGGFGMLETFDDWRNWKKIPIPTRTLLGLKKKSQPTQSLMLL